MFCRIKVVSTILPPWTVNDISSTQPELPYVLELTNVFYLDTQLNQTFSWSQAQKSVTVPPISLSLIPGVRTWKGRDGDGKKGKSCLLQNNWLDPSTAVCYTQC